MSARERAKATIILATICIAVLLVILAGCKSMEPDHSSREYVREHGPCKVLLENIAGPGYFGGVRVRQNPSYTAFECNGVRVFVDYVNGKPWRP